MIKDSLENQQIEINNLINWFLSKKSIKHPLTSDYKFFLTTLSKNLSYLYSNLKIKKLKNNYNTKVKIKLKKYNLTHIKKFDTGLKKNNIILINQVKKLQKYLLYFIVHGSFATSDFIKGWSDFDTLLVIKDKTLLDEKVLNEFREKIVKLELLLSKIDPYQHHGFLFITEFDLKNYSSSFLPIEVLQNAKVITKKNALEINYQRNKKYWINKFLKLHNLFKESYKNKFLEHHHYKGIYLKDNFQDMNTMYQMKYFLSLIMFIPCLYYECLGKPMYKKYSFTKLYSSKDKINFELIKKASLIRNSWKEKNNLIKNNRIPNSLKKKLGRNYFKRAYLLTSSLKKILIKK